MSSWFFSQPATERAPDTSAEDPMLPPETCMEVQNLERLIISDHIPHPPESSPRAPMPTTFPPIDALPTTATSLPDPRLVQYDEAHENQRWVPGVRWTARALLPTERGAFTGGPASLCACLAAHLTTTPATTTDACAAVDAADVAALPPSGCWAWSRSWEVVRGQCDADGWQYAAGWPKGGAQWAATPTLSHVVRRRRWRRARVWTGTLAEMEQWEATCAPPQPRVETEVSESTSSVVASPSAATLEKEMQQIERETAAMLRETEIESPLEETLQLSDNGDDEVELSMEEIERETAAILRETTENHPDSPLPPDGGVVSLEQLLADPLGTAAGPCSSEPDVGVMRLLDQPRVASDEEHAHAAAASGGPTAAAGLRQLLFGRVGDKANLTTTSDADTVQRKERTADDVRAKYGRPRQSELVEAAAEASERLAERGERIANLMHVSERMERDAQTMAIAAKKLAHNQKGWFGI